MQWSWKKFSELTTDELYGIIRLREQVFIVEQKCPYLDCDGIDPVAWHLAGYHGDQLAAYLRVIPPKIKYEEVAFGRVVTAPEARKSGFGKALTATALLKIEETFGRVPIRISAQAYLERFYGGFGFVKCGSDYMEDGIPHVEMLRS